MSNSALNFPLSLQFSSGGTADKPLLFYVFLKDTGKYERCLRGKCRMLFDIYDLRFIKFKRLSSKDIEKNVYLTQLTTVRIDNL